MSVSTMSKPGGFRSLSTRAVLNALLLFGCFLAIWPFLVMIFGSLKTPGELTTNPSGIPLDPTLSNYVQLLSGRTGGLVLRSLANSFLVTIPFTLLTVLFCAMAGYAFTRFNFRGKNLIFGLLVASMLVPTEVNIPSLYIMFSRIDWLNTYQVQILPGTASVLGMFMARQYMASLPSEVFEAARVDGAGQWRTFWSIALPMSSPVLGAIAVLTFVTKWSDYLWPRIMVTEPSMQPFMVLLPALSTSTNGFLVRYEVLLAGALLVTLPLVIVFIRFQKTLMSGAIAGAVRG